MVASLRLGCCSMLGGRGDSCSQLSLTIDTNSHPMSGLKEAIISPNSVV